MRPELALPGVLTGEEVEETAASILASQLDDGLILWSPGGHSDPWNMVEAAMALDVAGFGEAALAGYDWLARHQDPAGWWHSYYVADGVKDAKIDTNVCAYVATGIWHHFLLTGDRSFLATFRPVVERALDFVLTLQKPRGEVIWARHRDGTPWSFALLTGSSSILHSLRCGIAVVETLGDERPDWELAAARLAQVIAETPHAFEPKDRWAMDWYYPVLAGPLRGETANARLDDGWDRFVIPGRGVRCVADRPWVTAAETAECALAHTRAGLDERAATLLGWIGPLRVADGTYLTGQVYPEERSFPPGERTTYTAGAVVLAVDALSRATPASGLFVDDAAVAPLVPLPAPDDLA
jgi:MMP endo-(1,4)-3-O-methyl-alpha-D-mannosidase